MTTPPCPREDDVLEMVTARRWPDRCDEELAGHISGCRACEDLAAVAGALLEDQEAAWHEASIPASTVVWWRAQARAREEAVRAAARPIAFAQGAAASCAIWIAVSLLRAFSGAVPLDWRGWVHRLSTGVPGIPDMASAVPGGLLFLMVIGSALLLVPVALLVVWREVLREE